MAQAAEATEWLKDWAVEVSGLEGSRTKIFSALRTALRKSSGQSSEADDSRGQELVDEWHKLDERGLGAEEEPDSARVPRKKIAAARSPSFASAFRARRASSDSAATISSRWAALGWRDAVRERVHLLVLGDKVRQEARRSRAQLTQYASRLREVANQKQVDAKEARTLRKRLLKSAREDLEKVGSWRTALACHTEYAYLQAARYGLAADISAQCERLLILRATEAELLMTDIEQRLRNYELRKSRGELAAEGEAEVDLKVEEAFFKSPEELQEKDHVAAALAKRLDALDTLKNSFKIQGGVVAAQEQTEHWPREERSQMIRRILPYYHALLRLDGGATGPNATYGGHLPSSVAALAPHALFNRLLHPPLVANLPSDMEGEEAEMMIVESLEAQEGVSTAAESSDERAGTAVGTGCVHLLGQDGCFRECRFPAVLESEARLLEAFDCDGTGTMLFQAIDLQRRKCEDAFACLLSDQGTREGRIVKRFGELARSCADQPFSRTEPRHVRESQDRTSNAEVAAANLICDSAALREYGEARTPELMDSSRYRSSDTPVLPPRSIPSFARYLGQDLLARMIRADSSSTDTLVALTTAVVFRAAWPLAFGYRRARNHALDAEWRRRLRPVRKLTPVQLGLPEAYLPSTPCGIAACLMTQEKTIEGPATEASGAKAMERPFWRTSRYLSNLCACVTPSDMERVLLRAMRLLHGEAVLISGKSNAWAPVRFS
eukprot:scaffold2790_cov239-Pinguiococcus_pyrenoidosus.AAC.9